MDFERLLAIIGRHWRAVAIVLVVTVVAVLQVPGRVTPDFKVTGSAIVLSPPNLAAQGDATTLVNPWARLSTAETGAAAALVQVLDSDAVVQEVLADAAVSGYTVGGNPANGAIIDISVVASEEVAALTAFDVAFERLQSELRDRQEMTGAPSETWLAADLLTRPDRAEQQPGSQTRAMLAVGVLGVAAAICMAIALDVVIEPRRHRRSTAVAPAADETSTDEPAVAAAPSVLPTPFAPKHRHGS
jgi:uncharacterized protein involved in exopolysaccharide biosynthesis